MSNTDSSYAENIPPTQVGTPNNSEPGATSAPGTSRDEPNPFAQFVKPKAAQEDEPNPFAQFVKPPQQAPAASVIGVEKTSPIVPPPTLKEPKYLTEEELQAPAKTEPKYLTEEELGMPPKALPTTSGVLGTAADVGKQVVSGVAEGVEALPGVIPTISKGLGKLITKYVPQLTDPEAERVQQQNEEFLNKTPRWSVSQYLPKAQTTLGERARLIGNFIPASLGAPGKVIPALVSAASAGESGYELKKLAPSKEWEPWFEAAGAFLGGVGSYSALNKLVPETAKTGIKAAANIAAAPISPEEAPFNVLLSKGQATQDLPLIQAEQAALRNSLGEAAQKHAENFVKQQQGQLTEAAQTISEKLNPKTNSLIFDPRDAADVITNSLSVQYDNNAAALAKRAEQLQQAQERIRTSLNPSATEAIQSPLDATDIIGGSVNKSAAISRAATKSAYDALRELPGNFHPAAFNNIGEKIRTALNKGDSHVRINPQTTPVANDALGDLDDILSGLKQERDLDTGRLLKKDPITPQFVEDTRKRLNTFYNDARATNNWSDVRAVRGIISAFDDQVADRLAKGTFMGGDASAVIDTMKNARALSAKYKKTFEPQGSGDTVGKAVEKIIGRYEGQEATAEQISDTMFSDKPQSVQVAKRLKSIFGEGSPEIGAAKQGLFSHITEPPPGVSDWGPAKVADRIDAFTTGKGRSLTKEYLNPNEISALQKYADDLRGHHAAINEKFGPAELRLRQLTGAAANVPYNSEAAARRLFNEALLGQKDSLATAKHLQDTFGEASPEMATYKQGLFQHSLNPGAKAETPGPKILADSLDKLVNSDVGKAVYSPEELKVLKSYADLQRKIVVPQGGANWSNTATPVVRALNGLTGWIGAAVGHVLVGPFTHIPGVAETVGWVGAKTVGKVGEFRQARKIANQMPLIGDAMVKYHKALAAYNKANTPLSRAALAIGVANLGRTVQPLGIDINQFPSLKGETPPQKRVETTPQRAFGGATNNYYADGGPVENNNDQETTYPALDPITHDIPLPPQRGPIPPAAVTLDPIIRQHVKPEIPGKWTERDEFYQKQENERSRNQFYNDEDALDRHKPRPPMPVGSPTVPYVDTYESTGERVPDSDYNYKDGIQYQVLKGLGIKQPERAVGGMIETNSSVGYYISRSGNLHKNTKGLKQRARKQK